MNHVLKRGYIWMGYHVCKEEFEDTKGVIRIHKSKKNRQHNDQMKKYKRANNSLQSIHIKLNSSNTNPLTTRVSSCAPEEYSVPATLVAPVGLI